MQLCRFGSFLWFSGIGSYPKCIGCDIDSCNYAYGLEKLIADNEIAADHGIDINGARVVFSLFVNCPVLVSCFSLDKFYIGNEYRMQSDN